MKRPASGFRPQLRQKVRVAQVRLLHGLSHVFSPAFKLGRTQRFGKQSFIAKEDVVLGQIEHADFWS
jgi:hypothetical protein